MMIGNVRWRPAANGDKVWEQGWVRFPHMGRQYQRLSNVNRLAKASKTPGMHADGDGLYLCVANAESASWIFRFKIAGRSRDMGLGSLRDVTLEEARQQAAEARKLKKQAIDPIAAKAAQDAARAAQQAQEAAKAVTFEECAGAYINSHRPSWRNAKHGQQWQNTLKTYAYPVIGPLPVADVDTALVMRILEPQWTAKPETMGRLRGRIENILDWAKTRGFREGENPARWRGHLANLLPKRAKVRRVQHHAALPYDKAPAFMRELRKSEDLSRLALQFTILTAARTSETIGARWDHISLPKGLWVVPADLIKGQKEHRVPLTAPAIAVLKKLSKLKREDGFVFPGPRKGKHLSNGAMLMLLERMGRSDITVHGFRSTFKDWALECTTFAPEVSEMALAHVVEDKVEAAYRRGDLLKKRRGLMEAWAKHLESAKAKTARREAK
jgi:integrase